jgi:hypothetical protein
LKVASTAAGVKVERPNGTYDLDAGEAAPSCPLPEERVSGQLIGLLYTPATGGRAVAAALNETSGPYLGGRIELSRRLHHPQLLPLVGEVGRRLGFSIEVV